MIDVDKPYCNIYVTTKGGEQLTYSMQIESIDSFDFEKWFDNKSQHEPLFHVDGYRDYIAFDSILKLTYYECDGTFSKLK